MGSTAPAKSEKRFVETVDNIYWKFPDGSSVDRSGELFKSYKALEELDVPIEGIQGLHLTVNHLIDPKEDPGQDIVEEEDFDRVKDLGDGNVLGMDWVLPSVGGKGSRIDGRHPLMQRYMRLQLAGVSVEQIQELHVAIFDLLESVEDVDNNKSGDDSSAESGSIPADVSSLILSLNIAASETGSLEPKNLSTVELQAIINANDDAISKLHGVVKQHEEAKEERKRIEAEEEKLGLNIYGENFILSTVTKDLFDKAVAASSDNIPVKNILLTLRDVSSGYAGLLVKRGIEDESLVVAIREQIVESMGKKEEDMLDTVVTDLVEGIEDGDENLVLLKNLFKVINAGIGNHLEVIDGDVEKFLPIREIQKGVKDVAGLRGFLRLNFEQGEVPLFDSIVRKPGSVTFRDIKRLWNASQLEDFGVVVSEPVGNKMNELMVKSHVSLTIQAMRDVDVVKERFDMISGWSFREPFVRSLFTLAGVREGVFGEVAESGYNYKLIKTYNGLIKALKKHKLSVAIPYIKKSFEGIESSDLKEMYGRMLMSEYYKHKKAVVDERLEKIQGELREPYKEVVRLMAGDEEEVE